MVALSRSSLNILANSTYLLLDIGVCDYVGFTQGENELDLGLCFTESRSNVGLYVHTFC